MNLYDFLLLQAGVNKFGLKRRTCSVPGASGSQTLRFPLNHVAEMMRQSLESVATLLNVLYQLEESLLEADPTAPVTDYTQLAVAALMEAVDGLMTHKDWRKDMIKERISHREISLVWPEELVFWVNIHALSDLLPSGARGS